MKKQLFTALMLFAVFLSYGQRAAVVAGGEASGSGGTASFSLGESAYRTDAGNGGSSLQGAQQPYEIYEVSKPGAIGGMVFTLYPNPVADVVNIDVGQWQEHLSYQLLSLDGKILASGTLREKTTSLAMSDFPAGVYLVSVHRDDQPIKTFRIIKNQ
jgi:hypothetical protein